MKVELQVSNKQNNQAHINARTVRLRKNFPTHKPLSSGHSSINIPMQKAHFVWKNTYSLHKKATLLHIFDFAFINTSNKSNSSLQQTANDSHRYITNFYFVTRFCFGSQPSQTKHCTCLSVSANELLVYNSNVECLAHLTWVKRQKNAATDLWSVSPWQPP